MMTVGFRPCETSIRVATAELMTTQYSRPHSYKLSQSCIVLAAKCSAAAASQVFADDDNRSSLSRAMDSRTSLYCNHNIFHFSSVQ